MPALNVMSLLMGVTSLCNIWLLAVLGCAELCLVLDLRMLPDSWEAGAVSRHIVCRQCFDEGALRHGRLPSESGAAVQRFQVNRWLTLMFPHYVIKIIVGFGVAFYPRLDIVSLNPINFTWLGRKSKSHVDFHCPWIKPLTWAWKVWLFDGSLLYAVLLKGEELFWCVEWDCKY